MSHVTEAEALAILERPKRRIMLLSLMPIPPKRVVPDEPSLAQILWAVARVTSTSELGLVSCRRNRHLVRAKWLFYVSARNLTSKSFPQIAQHCHKNHTTVLHGCEQVAKRYSEYRDDLAAIERMIAGMNEGWEE